MMCSYFCVTHESSETAKNFVCILLQHFVPAGQTKACFVQTLRAWEVLWLISASLCYCTGADEQVQRQGLSIHLPFHLPSPPAASNFPCRPGW